MGRRTRLLAALSAAVLVIGVGCGDDDGDELPEEEPAEEEAAEEVDAPAGEADGSESAPTSGDEPSLSASSDGLVVGNVAFDGGWVSVLNMGDGVIDLSDHWVCNQPDYVRLPPIELGPGEGVQVDVPNLDPAGGEAGLYRSDDFANSSDIVSYVHWGAGGGRASVAEEAGVWSGPPVDAAGLTGVQFIGVLGEQTSAAGWDE